MSRAVPITMLAALLLATAVELEPQSAVAQQPSKPRPTPSPSRGAAQPHGEHGTPKGWKFTWPKGDSTKGREVFAKLECYACHEVRGEKFPAPTDKGKVGPELSQMGPLHDSEYFAESIINPSAVIDKGKGYEATDGSSKMPSFNDSATVQEVIDLVAFLRGLKPVTGTPARAKPETGGHMKH